MTNKNTIEDFTVNSKLIIITHSDLDGSVCGLMLKYLYKDVFMPDDIINYKCSYASVNSVSKEILNGIPDGSLVIYSDICPSREVIGAYMDRLGDKVVVLDHHESAKDNIIDGCNNIVVTSDSSACNTVIKFSRREYNMSSSVMLFTDAASSNMISKFSLLASIADDYDSWRLADSRSISMNDLYFYDKDEFDRDMECGFSEFSEYQLNVIRGINNKKDAYYKTLRLHQICDGAVRILLCDIDSYISEMANRVLIDTEADIILARAKHNVSVRSVAGSAYSAKQIAELAGGGGHDLAAGFSYSGRRDLENKIGSILEMVGE